MTSEHDFTCNCTNCRLDRIEKKLQEIEKDIQAISQAISHSKDRKAE